MKTFNTLVFGVYIGMVLQAMMYLFNDASFETLRKTREDIKTRLAIRNTNSTFSGADFSNN